MGLPLSSVSVRPISSARALSMSARRHSTFARSRGFIFCQSEPGSICARAALTAASTSSAPAEATSAIFSSVAGLMVANVAPERASTKSPLMKSLFWMDASVTAGHRTLSRYNLNCEAYMTRGRGPVAFYKRTWFVALTAIIGVTGGILGIILGVIPLFRAASPRAVWHNAEFVVDSSEGMNALFDGIPKGQAAAEAFDAVLQNQGMQRDNLALREFGGVCGRPQMKPSLDFSTRNEEPIRKRLESLSPHGQANLVETLLQ